MIQFFKTKGIAILGVFLVMSMFLINMNTMTAHAISTSTFEIKSDGTVCTMPSSSEARYLLSYDGRLTTERLVNEISNFSLKLYNNSSVPFELYGFYGTNRIVLLTIDSGETYILDNNFWNECYEKHGNQGLTIDCSGNGEGALEVSKVGDSSTEDDTEIGGTPSEDEDEDSGLFESIKEFISGLFEDIPTWIDNAVASIGEFFSQIPTWISNAVDSIGKFFANLITKIGEFVDSAVESIGEFFSNVGQWISDAVASIGEFFSNMFNSIADFFSDLVESVVEWFKNKKEEEETKKGFWESFGEKLKELIDKLAGFTLQPIKEFFSGLVNSDVISVLSTIYEFPIVKEMIILVVAVLVVTGLLGLLLTF